MRDIHVIKISGSTITADKNTIADAGKDCKRYIFRICNSSAFPLQVTPGTADALPADALPLGSARSGPRHKKRACSKVPRQVPTCSNGLPGEHRHYRAEYDGGLNCYQNFTLTFRNHISATASRKYAPRICAGINLHPRTPLFSDNPPTYRA